MYIFWDEILKTIKSKPENVSFDMERFGIIVLSERNICMIMRVRICLIACACMSFEMETLIWFS